MSDSKFVLSAAGNTEVPAYLVLRQKGSSIATYGRDSLDAGKGGLRFQAKSLIELLGLVTIHEVRGVDWAATDQEIDDFLERHDG